MLIVNLLPAVDLMTGESLMLKVDLMLKFDLMPSVDLRSRMNLILFVGGCSVCNVELCHKKYQKIKT